MFVDASALVAILIDEPDARALADCLERADTRITSPIAVYEAAAAIARRKKGGFEAARADVQMLLDAVPIAVVDLTLADADQALAAFARFGKGQGHPAKLNMGDCFAYAVAKNRRVALLFKGDDFHHTDIASSIERP